MIERIKGESTPEPYRPLAIIIVIYIWKGFSFII